MLVQSLPRGTGIVTRRPLILQLINREAKANGVKRKHDIVEEEDEEVDAEESIPIEDDEDAEATEATNYVLKVNPDGTVEQEDTVRYVHITFINVLLD